MRSVPQPKHLPRIPRRVALATLLALGLVGTIQPVAAQSVTTERLHALGHVNYHQLTSETVDHEYHLFVRLPESYDENSSDRHPTVYLLDGGSTFPLLGSYYNALRFAGEAPDGLILVGISYGTTDWRKGNMRGRDFTAPSAEREHWGGADAFAQFLEKELFPMIEGRYRSDPGRRVIFGHSLGGQFVLRAAQKKPSLFWGSIASNPALHRNLKLFLEPAAANSSTPSSSERPRLFVASGSLDDPRFREPAVQWMEHWSQMSSTPWQLETRTLEGHSHMSAVPASFRQGIAWIFSGSD